MAWPFNRKIEVKENPVGAAFFVGGAEWARTNDPRKYIAEGYQLNVVVYSAITEICRAVAGLEVEVVTESGDVLDKHPALDLLRKPNPAQGGAEMLAEMFTNYLLTGEMAAVRSPDAGKPVELWAVNPIYLAVKPGKTGMAAGYTFDAGQAPRQFTVNPVTGDCPLFFLKMYNPLDYWRGQAPLVAAALAADTHNSGMRWNYALLRNSARPSGLIKLAGEASGQVVASIREWFKRAWQGEEGAGAVPVLPNGAEWVPMASTSRDMDFMNTQKEAAKLIARAFGVPLPLIDNDASTFNNLEQARERFYTDTVLPMFKLFLERFGAWILPAYGGNLRFQVNEDKIGALEGIRTRLFERMLKAVSSGVLTTDEAREAIGYDPLGNAAAVEDLQKAMARLGYGE